MWLGAGAALEKHGVLALPWESGSWVSSEKRGAVTMLL